MTSAGPTDDELDKFIKFRNSIYPSSQISFLILQRPLVKQGKITQITFNKAKDLLEEKIRQFAEMVITYYKRTGKNPETNQSAVYDAKIMNVPQLLTYISSYIDTHTYSPLDPGPNFLSMITQSAVNSYLEERDNPPSAPPEAPPVPPLKIETDKGTVSIPPLK